jgi:hypothetical protein
MCAVYCACRVVPAPYFSENINLQSYDFYEYVRQPIHLTTTIVTTLMERKYIDFITFCL